MQKIRFFTALCVLALLLLGFSGENNAAEGTPGENVEIAAPEGAIETASVPAPSRGTPAEGEKLTYNSPILTINADPVRWPEFHFWLNFIGKYYKNSLGIEEITDWNVQQNGMGLADFFLSTAVGYAQKDRAIEAEANALGIELSEEDIAEIEEKRASNIQIYGSVSEYRRIVASMYMSEEVFNYLTKIDYLGNYLFEHFYGKNGEKFTDREVSAYIEENSLMCAKYIFRSNFDTAGNPLTAEKLAENTRLLEDLLEKLDSSDAPSVLFGELLKAYGEDEAISIFPNGRLLLPGSKGTEFETACAGLRENGYSGVVATKGGSYIIMRMPIYPEMTADSAGNTLRYHAAYERFKKKVAAWSTEMNVVYEDAYYQVNVEELL